MRRYLPTRSRSAASASPHAALLAAAIIAALTAPVAAQLQFEELPRKGLPVFNDPTVSVTLGDVDGDGDLDMVCGNNSIYGTGQQTRLFLNNGSGMFTDATAASMPVDNDSTSSVALGDVDGDGDLDIVCGNTSPSGEQDRLYVNNGSGTFTDATAQMPANSDFTDCVALGDVDGDGDLDLVCGNANGQNRLYVNNGGGTFTDATAASMPVDSDSTFSVALGDVDGDGDLDMVCGNAISGQPQNRLYLNNGSGTFTEATAASLPVDGDWTFFVALDDVDGDGDLDIVCANSGYPSGQQNRLYLNNGSGTFIDATAASMPVDNDFTSSVALGDVDGDGDLDIACGNGGQKRLYLNNGSGTFTDATAASMPAYNDYTSLVALGDVDGDGDLDMVCGNFGQNCLYLNLQRQLHAPTAPQIGQPYTLDAYMRNGTSTVANFSLAYLSTASDSIPSPFGTIGIDLAAAAPFPTLIVPQPAGVVSIGFTVPNVPSLVGQPIYCQSMFVAYPYDWRLSNVVADVIQ